MDPQLTGQADLSNDTVVNVAALLREQTGATRLYRFTVDHLRLDDDLDAVGLSGSVRLTRLSDAILVSVNGESSVELECQRCLEQFSLPVSFAFTEQFRIAYDVRRGTAIEGEIEAEDERPEISENHELDFSEPMRQEIIVALPMRQSVAQIARGRQTSARPVTTRTVANFQLWQHCSSRATKNKTGDLSWVRFPSNESADIARATAVVTFSSRRSTWLGAATAVK
jgi:uncharacterized protein